MSEAARQTQHRDLAGVNSEAMMRLMANLSESARQGTWAVLRETSHPRVWQALDQAIAGVLASRANADISALRTLNLFISIETLWLLKKVDVTGERCAAFETLEREVDCWGDSWTMLAPAEDLARTLHAAVLWHAVWHLVEAGFHLYHIFPLIHGRSVRVAAAEEYGRSSVLLRVAEAAIGITQKETEDDTDPHLEALRVAMAAPLPRVLDPMPVLPPAPIQHGEADASVPVTPIVHLDTHRLDPSIFGTWVALVALSWVALIWGAVLTAPFGVGMAIASSALAGIIAVPVWATAWGFWGMKAAFDATMTELGFRPLANDHPLAQQNALYAQHLGITPPNIGTIDMSNALAMGVHRDQATIAIGKPLLESFHPREVAAILGHELGHIVSGDMRRMMLMRTFQNATVWFMMSQGFKQFARWIICWAAELYILACSRHREYIADAIGATLAGKEALISALQQLDKAPDLTEAENTHARFMVRGRFEGLFSTHPSIADRITALEQETYLRQLPFR